MGFDYSFTYRAEKDLDEILDYLSRVLLNKQAAQGFVSELENKINQLCEFPESAPVVENRFVDLYVVRKAAVKKYLVYYYVDQIKKTICILTILHSLEDQEKIGKMV